MMTEANQDPRQRIMKKNIKSLSKNSLPYYERFSPYFLYSAPNLF